MLSFRFSIAVTLGLACAWLSASPVSAVEMSFAGSHYDIGGTFFPGGSPPYTTVPWRTSGPANTFSTGTEYPDQYYGRDGYALFTTYFNYPNNNSGASGEVDDFIFSETAGIFRDLVELPDFVTDSEILSTRRAGGHEYSLIDDPERMTGIRHWTFDGVNYPPAGNPEEHTGGNPYVKLGLLTGSDFLGSDPATTPTARWGFEVGEGVPESFRVGVMTDGLDASHFSAAEVFLTHAIDDVPQTTIGSGERTRNRFVDIHFFDIVGAQPGDQFAFSAMKGASDPGFASAGVSGFTFDIIPTVVGLPGDFNSDGMVDAADYVVWRNNLGGDESTLNGGGDNSGTVDIGDYDTWKLNFGSSAPGSVLAGPSNVPEPSSVLLIAAFGGLVAVARKWCA